MAKKTDTQKTIKVRDRTIWIAEGDAGRVEPGATLTVDADLADLLIKKGLADNA